MTVPFTFTIDEYYQEFGITPQSENNEEKTFKINQVCRYVWQYVNVNSSIDWQFCADNSKLSNKQIQVLKCSAMEQLLYEETNGVIRNFGGIDYETNNLSDIAEIQKRAIAPNAFSLLSHNGFFYKGLGA